MLKLPALAVDPNCPVPMLMFKPPTPGSAAIEPKPDIITPEDDVVVGTAAPVASLTITSPAVCA